MRNEEGGNSISTVVLRGSTDSILDDLERAVDDGVNTYKVIDVKYQFFLLFKCMLLWFLSMIAFSEWFVYSGHVQGQSDSTWWCCY